MSIAHVASYNQLWRSLYVAAINGQRIHYSKPSFEKDEQQRDVCTIFKIKQRIHFTDIEDLHGYEHDRTFKNVKDLDKYMDLLCKEIESHTRKMSSRPIGQRITHMWPTGPFEEWIDETHHEHWMTANWFKDESRQFSDYATVISVKAPITIPLKDYEQEYGEAFVMTKIGYF